MTKSPYLTHDPCPVSEPNECVPPSHRHLVKFAAAVNIQHTDPDVDNLSYSAQSYQPKSQNSNQSYYPLRTEPPVSLHRARSVMCSLPRTVPPMVATYGSLSFEPVGYWAVCLFRIHPVPFAVAFSSGVPDHRVVEDRNINTFNLRSVRFYC